MPHTFDAGRDLSGIGRKSQELLMKIKDFRPNFRAVGQIVVFRGAGGD